MTAANKNFRSRLKKIKLLLLDVDGVLTDGTILLDHNGNEMKSFHVRDGHGIKLAQRAGIRVGIITGRKSAVVALRARELGIEEVHQGAQDKLIVYEALLEKYGLHDDEAAFIGDDVVDLEILKRAGLAVTVADADPAVRPHADFITQSEGGRGAVREFINLLLAGRGELSS